jgi:hypothetical protein
MTKTIYIITTGTYSDYHICAAFSTKKKAEEYINEMVAFLDVSPSEYTIEQMELDAPIDNRKIIQVYMDKYGNVNHLYPMDDIYSTEGFQSYDTASYLIWNVHTDNKQKAVKVVNEKRIQILAHDTSEKLPLWNNEQKTRVFFNMKVRNK